MKRLIVFAALLMGQFPAGPDRLEAEQLKGRPRWQVTARNPPAVTHPDQPSQPMTFAASELRRYLGRILDVKIPEGPAGDDRPTIRLSVDRSAGLTDEGYELRADRGTYHITGGGDLGLVFGTYEFLRRCGGCLFSNMGPDGEYVPRKDRIEAEAGPLRMKPKLWYRGLQFYYWENAELDHQRIDWMAKNGLNYVMYTPAPEGTDPDRIAVIDPDTRGTRPPTPPGGRYQKAAAVDPRTGKVRPANPGGERYSKQWFDHQLRPEIRRRGLKLDMNHHNLLYWLPPGRYFADHPEYYALIDSKRGGQLMQLCVCTSNKDAVSAIIDNVRKYLRENPEVKIVGVIPEDGYGMCQCEKCVAGDLDPQDAFRRGKAENQSKTRRYARLINAVADAIREEFPDVLVGGAAYVDLSWPPLDIELAPNTTFWVALYWRDACRPMDPDDTSDLNKHFYDVLAQWKKVYPGRLIVYEYYMGMHAQLSLPYPMAEVICEDWKHLKRLGVEGATIQSRSSCHHVYALNNLAFARCGWYDDVDYAKVLNDFLRGTYGSVAREVRPIYEGLNHAVRTWAKCKGNLLPNGMSIGYFLDQVGRNTIHEALTTARERAGDDRERRQVAGLAAAARYWEMAANINELRTLAGRLRKTDPKVALALLEQIVNELWPNMQEHVETSMTPGWMTVSAPKRWNDRPITEMRNTIAKLRKEAR